MSVFAITKTEFEADVRKTVIDFNAPPVEVFKRQKDFIGLSQFQSREENVIVSVIEWVDASAHDACQDSVNWGPYIRHGPD